MTAWRYIYPVWWRLAHLRCTLLGCKWGREHTAYEIGHLYESWVECERCGQFGRTYHVYGGKTELGARLEREAMRKAAGS